jgi:peptidoglycan/xylan/chitin deacetylase (PgdA/CDA1 family)
MRKQCSLSRFEQVLAVLQKYFQFVTLDDAVAMISGEKPIRPYCAVLTFDDGYKNNFRSALPVLKQYGLPAIFFIPTGHITNQKPLWFDTLDYAIQCGEQGAFTLPIGGVDVFFDTENPAQVKKQYRSFLYQYNRKLQANDYDFQKKIFSQIKSWQSKSGINFSSVLSKDRRTALMTWEEVGQSCQAGVTIGSHTVDHLKLATLEDQKIEQQLQQSKADIEEHCSMPCKYLCYPNGNFDDRVIRIVRECGYQAAVTTVPKLNEVGENIYQLSRLGFPRRAEKFHIFNHIYRG